MIPPGVDVGLFTPSPTAAKDYFLVVSPLARWKRVDIAVRAFNQLRLPLKVVGDGEEEGKLRGIAERNVEFLGARTHAQGVELAEVYAGCRAFILTSEEDFGLTPLEAMACGRPVIALRAGGALETVVEDVTGRFFDHQSPDSLVETVASTDFEAFDTTAIRRHAEQFSVDEFKRRILVEIGRCVDAWSMAATRGQCR